MPNDPAITASVSSPPVGKALVVRGNALTLPVASGSVDLIVSSPPYWGLRSYQDGGEHYVGQVGAEASPDEFLAALWAVMEECWRVIKPGGSVWINLGDKFAGSGGNGSNAKGSAVTAYPKGDAPPKSLLGLPWRFAIGCVDGKAAPCVCEHGREWHYGEDAALCYADGCECRAFAGAQWTLRQEVIWAKPNGLPESVKDRCARKHEQWYHFTKQPRYYSAVDAIREPYTAAPFKGQKTHKAGDGGETKNPVLSSITKWDASEYQGNPLGKLPGSVWTVPTEPLKVPEGLTQHFAAFPSELVRRIVLGWSPLHVCDTCGEGLRTVTTSTRTRDGVKVTGAAYDPDKRRKEADGSNNMHYTYVSLEGWACPCGPLDQDVRTYKPGVILDPFGGTGTVAGVARALGRIGISNDLSADYSAVAAWRATEPKLEAKTRERTWPAPPKAKRARKAKPQVEQSSLFADDCDTSTGLHGEKR